MKQVLGIVHYNFFGYFRNPKVIFTFLLEFVLSFLLTGRIMVVMENYDTPVQAVEPFLWTFGDGTAVLLSSLLLLLLFSDLPKMTPVTPYQLIRTTKKKWLLGQFIYIILVTALYTVLMLLFTSVLCMKDSYPGNLWSETAAMLGYSELGKNLQVPSTVRVMESISPYDCMLQVFLLLFCYSLTLGFVILVGNLYKGKTKGMVFGLLYSVFGFLLEPSVVAAILHKEKYEMHRLIGALLSSELKEQGKLDIIEHEYNIPISSEFREDVSVMCNLSQGIVDDTEAKIIMNMYESKFSLEQISLATKKSIAEITKNH